MGSNLGLIVAGVLVAITNMTLTAYASSAPDPGTRKPVAANAVAGAGSEPDEGPVDMPVQAHVEQAAHR